MGQRNNPEPLPTNPNRFLPVAGEWLIPPGPIGESFESVGPRQIEGWLRRAEDMNFVFSLEVRLEE